MNENVQAMRIALRVLTAINEGHVASEVDIKELRVFAPLLADGPADELACDVIQQAMKRRAQTSDLLILSHDRTTP